MNRVKRLATLINDRYEGNQAAFSRAIGKSPAQVHQWLCGHRSVGDGTARHIEMTLELGEGWMDGTTKSSSSDMLAIYNSLDPQFQMFLLEQARSLQKITKK